jgi:hypothetical protein
MDYIKKELPTKINKIGWILTLAGLLIVIISYLVDVQRTSYNNLIALIFFSGIAIGALILVALEYLAGAVWSTPMRRVSEFLASSLPFMIILAIPLFLNIHNLFQWAQPELVKNDLALQHKSAYLNVPFIAIRFGVIFLIFYSFYVIFVRNSRKQDTTKDQRLTKINLKFSAAFMPLGAILLTLFAIDWMMSLVPHWYSTIFGFYFITSTLLAGLAATTYVAVTLNEKGYLHPSIGEDHYYSYGALLFAMTNFWAYIAFSQFMLIWYANIPEETTWFLLRWTGSWKYLSVGMVLVRFAIPYVGLLSYNSKMNPKNLKRIAIFILFAHLFDTYWLIMPSYSPGIIFSFYEIGFPVLIVGVIILVFYAQAKKYNLVPIGDPKLQRGLDFHL